MMRRGERPRPRHVDPKIPLKKEVVAWTPVGSDSSDSEGSDGEESVENWSPRKGGKLKRVKPPSSPPNDEIMFQEDSSAEGLEGAILGLVVFSLLFMALVHFGGLHSLVRELALPLLFFVGFPVIAFIVLYFYMTQTEAETLQELIEERRKREGELAQKKKEARKAKAALRLAAPTAPSSRPGKE
jgi:hypothetical protein